MFEKESDKSFHHPDRPLECGECKKPIAVRYTEIVGNQITHTSMCADCPELQRRLHGTSPQELVANQTGMITGLACGNCRTTLEEIRRGHRLGCSDCYSVFEDILLGEIQSSRRLLPKISPINKKNAAFHVGRMPGENLTISPSSRLLALNEALKETLSREDYEQAAFLRDQIKELTETDSSQTPKEKTDESDK